MPLYALRAITEGGSPMKSFPKLEQKSLKPALRSPSASFSCVGAMVLVVVVVNTGDDNKRASRSVDEACGSLSYNAANLGG